MISNEDTTPLDAHPRVGLFPGTPTTSVQTPRQDSATPEPVRRDDLRSAIAKELRDAFHLYALTVLYIVGTVILLETCL